MKTLDAPRQCSYAGTHMGDLEKLADDASKRWATRTLEAFRREAEKELNGTAYEAIRPSTAGKDGPRLFLVVCVTGKYELSLVETSFKFTDEGACKDWDTYTLADMLLDTESQGGLSYQGLVRDSKRVAVALCASRPDKVKILETLFQMPP